MSKSDQELKSKPLASMEELVIGSTVYQTRLTTKFRERINWARPDEKKVTAFIPGTIQKIMVKEGNEVAQGMPLLILEAMKMRNELLSPLGGVIKKIHIAEGDMVPKDKLLIEFK